MTIRQSIEVHVPVGEAYARWMRLETFPSVMDGVTAVEALAPGRTRWSVDIAGVRRQWTSELVEAAQDEFVAWRTTEGVSHRGSVRFAPVNGHATRIEVEIEWEPSGPLELVGWALGVVSGRVEGNLERFKEFAELGRTADTTPGEAVR